MNAFNRRAALGLTASAAVVLSSSESAAAATPVGPWTYVAPGESIQAAINSGAKAIQLGVGVYIVTAPIVPTRGCAIRGVGQHTRIVAGAAIADVVAIGNGGAVDGVYIGDLVIDCKKLASDGIDLHINGTTDFFMDEPDAVCRLDNLWVYDAVQDGVSYRGTDTQAITTSRVRVRRAGQHGFNIAAPDNWWIACEATTSKKTDSSAGFFVGGANNVFDGCKAWYCRDYGFHIRGTRNRFVGCESQDTRSHGWFIDYDKNTFVGCTADTAGYSGVGGTPGTADGFYMADNIATTIVGCLAFDRRPGSVAAQQRYGFNVPASAVTAGRVAAYAGWDNVSGLINKR